MLGACCGRVGLVCVGGGSARVLERLAAGYGPVAAGDDVGAALQPRHVPPQQIEQHGFSNVVGVVAGAYGVNLEQRGAAVQRLPPEHTAKRAVVLVADFANNSVHAPAVQLLVRQHRQLERVLPRVPLHRLKSIVPVSSDALVDAE